MIFNAIGFVFPMVLSLLLKTGMYYGVFHWQRIPATVLSCIAIAGSGIIVSLLPLFFIPAPVVVIGLASYLCSKYTGIAWFPNALVIALIVELVAHYFMGFVLMPIINML